MVIVGCEGGERPITHEPKQGTRQRNSRDEEIPGIVRRKAGSVTTGYWVY